MTQPFPVGFRFGDWLIEPDWISLTSSSLDERDSSKATQSNGVLRGVADELEAETTDLLSDLFFRHSEEARPVGVRARLMATPRESPLEDLSPRAWTGALSIGQRVIVVPIGPSRVHREAHVLDRERLLSNYFYALDLPIGSGEDEDGSGAGGFCGAPVFLERDNAPRLVGVVVYGELNSYRLAGLERFGSVTIQQVLENERRLRMRSRLHGL